MKIVSLNGKPYEKPSNDSMDKIKNFNSDLKTIIKKMEKSWKMKKMKKNLGTCALA
jgi:hypothetical protein